MLDFNEFAKNKTVAIVSLEQILSEPAVGPYKKHRDNFAQNYLPGDIIYHYCSDDASWEAMMGSEGYIIVRNGSIIDSLTVRMN